MRGTSLLDIRDKTKNEEEDDEDDDYDNLKPNIANPTWLGPLETYDLPGGACINPSINRYLHDYQRTGVSLDI